MTRILSEKAILFISEVLQNVSKLMWGINEEILTEVGDFKFSVEILRAFYIKNVNFSYRNQIW